MDQLYREIILEHWEHPQNFGVLENADIDVTEMNPLCGDMIRLTIVIEKGTIKKILFSGESCAIARASASLFTEYVKNKTLQEVTRMEEKEVLALLGIELTPAREKCALLVHTLIQKLPL